MSEIIQDWGKQLANILDDFSEQVSLNSRQIFVIGCSTSEVAGKKIGTAGTEQVAEMIFTKLMNFSEKTGVALAFQCCEHLNRAIVVERATAEAKNLEEVTVVPVRTAGGAMATYAYEHFNDPVVVEHIQADAGIDIGDTFIGMHLKHVAVPIRTSQKMVGDAHVTLAKVRPKLIGGARAVYERKPENESCS
ncbi:TIGR01440 family protein [Bacillus sp. S/N-304-OC-R1]|uniref:TIGR01440 family protein n=1 Tax=Bacillus sp. S/N-304-OC-R1 TaxID=2758034 RepID=UPI001C8D6096|nr:TIGR01440 family protein [Bacillus sp. S/N-304-OC-R1]MBY0123245.1 TIGR01440 family protein [Bacillus sp. S/N-304-OC-R1]